MHLYNLTVQPPTATLQAVVGNFSGTRQQLELGVSRGTRLELVRLDSQTGKLSTVVASDAFGSIHSLATLRLTGESKDYVVVSSDSGRIVTCHPGIRSTQQQLRECSPRDYGKSGGARRVVPGQYLATDSKGRAVMISFDNALHLVVGTAQDTSLSPRACTSGFLLTFKFVEDGRYLGLLHKMEIDDIPLAVFGFQGRLAAGIEKALRLYDIGRKQLLRKVENKNFPSAIVTLSTQGSRIIVGGMQESIHYAAYRPLENRLVVFADDTQARWITATTMLDYDTVAAGDRFGNVFVNRLDPKVS